MSSCYLKGVVAQKVDSSIAIGWIPVNTTLLVGDVAKAIGHKGNSVGMETLDTYKGSLGYTTNMKCGCMVVGAPCLKEGQGAREE
jgi:hypothetical protein